MEGNGVALISFDLDGVLQQNPFQSSRHDGVFGHIKRELAPRVLDAADPEAAAAIALKLLLDEHQARMHAGRMVEAFDWDGIVATVAGQLGHPERLDVAALVTQYAPKTELCWLYPGVAECLQTLSDAGHTLISITNGYRSYQEPVLRQLGVLSFFKAMVSPEAAGAAKPEAAIFRFAEQFGGAPRVHIGDTLPHDIAGAKRAGWQAIYIVQPDAPGYTELPTAVARFSPWERPARAGEWLQHRLERDRLWHGFPPAELAECIPDAIVTALHEVPAAIAQIAARG
jgi:putative hydrolase of the HAD superfamily